MKIDQSQLQTVIDHALREAPNECCGMLSVKDGTVDRVFVLENATPSPFRFEIDPKVLRDTYTEIDDAGADMVIYHSHTRSDPIPSQTDVNFGRNWPGVEWLIVGTKGEVTYRSWLISAGGDVDEVPVEVTGGS
ncbi:CysO-cysteine peptidase [Paraconexibacter sp. AEG42_29]|uniref:CysO-cysteine peptidase n=1 Tax=Paraconexibacter sp. AEG42_29 TaxID=2997339 RepID=A0AAU7AY44_9ACTN